MPVGRRLLQTAVILFSLLAAPGLRSGVLASSDLLTHGPFLGAVTDSTAIVWARAGRTGRLQVEHKTSDQLWPGRLVEGGSFTPEHDFTAVASLTGLAAASRYDYRLLVDRELTSDDGNFRTLPTEGRSGRFRFALGGDLIESLRPFTILDRVREAEPDFNLLLGDLVYADSPTSIPATVEAYRTKYRTNWSDPSFRHLTASVPSFTMWDDHEIVNDYDGGDAQRYRAARQALDEYIVGHDPPSFRTGAIYFSFHVADVDFFVLDTRSYRGRNAAPDVDGGKTMLGGQQKADLKAWLGASRAPFKFILSSVPFHDFGQRRNDSWTSFSAERAELLEYIKQRGIGGVVILSGDQHWASLVQHSPFPVWEFNATPLAQYVARAPAQTDPRLVIAYSASTVFGLVEVDTTALPPTVTFSVIDNTGTPRATHTISAAR